MIDPKLHFFMLIALAVYFVLLISLLKKKHLNLRYTLLWLFSGCLMLFIALFPRAFGNLAAWIGVEVPANALFAILFFCILLLLISLTAIVSKLNDSVKILTQDIALLENKVRELTKQNAD